MLQYITILSENILTIIFWGGEIADNWLNDLLETNVYKNLADNCMLLSCHARVSQSHCCHLNFRYRAWFEQGVTWHSGYYRV